MNSLRHCGQGRFAEMIGLDTNVLVRNTMQDDATQSALATGLFESLSPVSRAT